MMIAILVLTIFNTGLMLLTIGGLALMKDEVVKKIAEAVDHTDSSIEAATTAVFNMESIKQKADMTGRFEI